MDEGGTPNIRAITLLSCAGFASMATMRVCDPLLPQLADTFETSTVQAAYVITAFAIAYGLLQMFYGPLGDRYGKYRVIAAATLGCTVGSLGAALADSLDWLIVCRALTGATAAGIIPLSMAWIGDTVPYERRQVTLARLLSGTTLGLIGGPFIGGLFADTVGWRWTFVLLAVIYVVVGLLLSAELRRHRPVHESPNSESRPSFLTRILVVLRIPWARTVLITVFLEGMIVFGVVAFIPWYLNARFNVSLAGAGAIISLYGVGGLVYILVARRLVHGLGERGLAIGGGLVLSGAFTVLLWGPVWFWALPASLMAGFGFYMLHNTLQTNATQMAPSSRGTAVSLFASSLFFGQSIGVAAAAMVIDRAGASWLFAIAAVALLVIGFGFAHALRSATENG